MKMRKLFAGLLATSIVAAGTSAFAAPVANDAGYNKTAGTYSITDATAEAIAGYGADQTTIIIIPEAAYNAEKINDGDILYIDQAAADTKDIFANVGILGGTSLEDGTYYVKIGGEKLSDDGIIVEKFTVTTTPSGDVEVHQWGDVNDDGETNSDDAMEIIFMDNFMDSIFDDEAEWRYIYGDVTDQGEGDVDSDDAMEIIFYDNFMDSVLDDLLG